MKTGCHKLASASEVGIREMACIKAGSAIHCLSFASG